MMMMSVQKRQTDRRTDRQTNCHQTYTFVSAMFANKDTSSLVDRGTLAGALTVAEPADNCFSANYRHTTLYTMSTNTNITFS